VKGTKGDQSYGIPADVDFLWCLIPVSKGYPAVVPQRVKPWRSHSTTASTVPSDAKSEITFACFENCQNVET
jgi:hypothetical protein